MKNTMMVSVMRNLTMLHVSLMVVIVPLKMTTIMTLTRPIMITQMTMRVKMMLIIKIVITISTMMMIKLIYQHLVQPHRVPRKHYHHTQLNMEKMPQLSAVLQL